MTVMADLRHHAQAEAWMERLDVAQITDPQWPRRGNCYGLPVDLMYPDNGTAARRATAVCTACPSRMSCLADARTREHDTEVNGDWAVYGVRGGLTATQRSTVYTRSTR